VKLQMFFLLMLLLLPVHAESQREAVIYYNQACSACIVYINQTLVPLLTQEGVKEVELRDYINNPQYRRELVALHRDAGVPPELWAHMSTVVDGRIFIEGHLPEQVIRDALQAKGTLVVYSDEMKPQESYLVWAPGGAVEEFDAGRSPLEYAPDGGAGMAQNYGSTGMLLLVVVSGLLDGINPCAFAVLLFFIAFLYTLQRSRMDVLRMGAIYISAIYLAYFLIGLGIMKAMVFAGKPHFMAKLGAWLIVLLGMINIINHFQPMLLPVKLRIPAFTHATLRRWAYRGTAPSAGVLGFLVGLCTFPCSGGIYVAILALLSAKTTYAQGLAYLMLYNLMFVMPLIVILAIASNERVTARLKELEEKHARRMRLFSGVVMLTLGVAILVWFA